MSSFKRKFKTCCFFILFMQLSINFAVSKNNNVGSAKVINSKMIKKIAKIDVLEREVFISRFANKIIHAKGYVESISKKRGYRRGYRIIIVDNSGTKVDIRYHLYTDNKEYLDLLKKSDLFEFKGQFIVHTPLNSRGTSYVFDVILQDGAILVE